MPLFQFTALDAAGKEKRGTIEAVTQQDAYAAIQRYGLHPTNVFAINQFPGGYPGTPPYSGEVRRGSGGGGFTTFLAVLALLLSLAGAGWQVYRDFLAPASRKETDPLGKGLSAYNFSTAKDAFRSQLKIRLSDNLRARLELDRLAQAPQTNEMLDTFDVRKEEIWNGITILYIVYKSNGVEHYLIQGFSKDAASERWLPRAIDRTALQKSNPELETRLSNWETKGQLS